MNNASSTTVNSKRGRPLKDDVSKYRTLLWYWAIRGKSGLKDGTLDMLFTNPEPDGKKRVYADRIRLFEDIRKKGRTISDGKHKRRNYNLIERVNSHTSLVGSASIYHSDLWEILADKKPALNQIQNRIVDLIEKCNLSSFQFEKQYQLNKGDSEIASILIGIPQEKIDEIFEDEVKIPGQQDFDDALSAFSMAASYSQLAEEVNFSLISKYLNMLAFLICLYRYAMSTGNHSLFISSSESIEAHLSFFLIFNIKWLSTEFKKKLFHMMYKNIFTSGHEIFDGLENKSYPKNSAISKLFDLLSNS